MITLERERDETTGFQADASGAWVLRAWGERPMIAEITGFHETYHYDRRFIGEREMRGGRHVSVAFAAFRHRPYLLHIRHGDGWNLWYILHGLDFEHLQLTEVNQAMMDHLVAQPLFAAHAIGSFRLLDPDVDLPAERRRKRHSPEPEVIASPVDTTPRPEPQRVPPEIRARANAEWGNIFTAALGMYENVVLHEDAPTTLEARRGRGRRRKEKPATSPKIEVLKPAAGRKFFNEN